MHGVFSTGAVDKRNRFAYWSDLVCDVFVRLDCRSPVDRDFNATMHYGSLEWLRVVKAESDAIEGIRSRRQISKGCEDDLLVSLQIQGTTLLVQDGREALLQPGDFALYDSERPYRLKMSKGTQLICLQFPRTQLSSRLGSTTPFVARTVPGDCGVSSLFVHLTQALPKKLSEISGSVSSAVADQVLDFLTLSLSSCDGVPSTLASGRAVTLARLKRVVRAHLRDPELNPARAASLAQMSHRHANRLLAHEGTSLERFILAERLNSCRAALRDRKLDQRTISEIAFAWGFSDSGHFSRSFRNRFGTSPREYRETTRQDAAR
jgi:AraC-like DNA-binding protein